MKDPMKRIYLAVLILTVVFLVFFALAIVASGNVELQESITGMLTSSLVDSETVTVMLVLCAVVPIGTLFITLCVLGIAKPLFQKYYYENKDRKHRKWMHSRFPSLKQMDETLKNAPEDVFIDKTLSEICDDFRNFAASKQKLYYDIADIRRFIAGMGISKLIILRGISGTGKTSLAYIVGEYFCNSSTIIPIQPMWKERSDIIGYFNEFTKRFNETKLLSKLYEAGGREHIYITVLDEVNIARIEYYFAEFLSLLEIPDPQKRKLDVVADSWDSDPERIVDGKILLPENMWFVGTANNDDSTFAISDKVYDRAAVIDLDRKCLPFEAAETDSACISYEMLNARFEQAKKDFSLSAENRIALAQLDNYLTDTFRISFGNRIMRQIEEYVPIMMACGGTEIDGLDDILSRKIFRKLEQVSPTLIKNEVPNLLNHITDLFGEEALPMSREFLYRIINAA